MRIQSLLKIKLIDYMEISLPGARKFNEFLGSRFTNLDILPPNYLFGNTMSGAVYYIEVVSGNQAGNGVYFISGMRGKLAQRQKKFIGVLPGYGPIDKPFLKKSDSVVFNALARLEHRRFKDLLADTPYPVYLAVTEYFNEPPPFISENEWASYLESHKEEVSDEIRKRVKLELLANSGSESDLVRENFGDGGKLPEAVFENLWTPETEALTILLIKTQNQKTVKSELDRYKKKGPIYSK